MNCDDRREQILLYLTDELDEADRDRLEEHLQAGCPRCLAELSAARETIGWLPLALSPQTPPKSIKHALMERLNHDESASPVRGATRSEPSQDPSLAEPKPKPEPEHEPQATSPRARRRRWRFIASWLSPAAAAVLAIGVTYAIMTVELRNSHQQFTELASEVAGLKGNLADSDARIAELTRTQQTTQEVFNIMESEEAMYVQLEGRNNGQSSFARMLLDLDSGLCYFFPSRNTPLERNRRYALWFFADDNGDPIEAAEFTLDERGPARFELHMPDDREQYTGVSVRRLPDRDESAADSSLTEVLFGSFGSKL